MMRDFMARRRTPRVEAAAWASFPLRRGLHFHLERKTIFASLAFLVGGENLADIVHELLGVRPAFIHLSIAHLPLAGVHLAATYHTNRNCS